MRRFFSATAAFLIFASSATAEQYLCDLKAELGDGFVPTELLLDFDRKAGTALVYDGIIAHVYGAPVEGDLKALGDGKIEVEYNVNNLPTSTRLVDIRYVLHFDPKDKSVDLEGKFRLFSYNLRGRGKCKTSNIKIN